MSLVKKTAEEIRELKRQKEEKRYKSIKIIVIFNISDIIFISRMRNRRLTGNSEVQGKGCALVTANTRFLSATSNLLSTTPQSRCIFLTFDPWVRWIHHAHVTISFSSICVLVTKQLLLGVLISLNVCFEESLTYPLDFHFVQRKLKERRKKQQQENVKKKEKEKALNK